MKQQVICLVAVMCLAVSMHAMENDEELPEYFKDLVCSAVGEPIDKQAVLNANQFWKEVAETASQEIKNNYLQQAVGLFGNENKQRDAIICALAAGARPKILPPNDRGAALKLAVERDDYYLAQYALQCGIDPNIGEYEVKFPGIYPLLGPVIFFATSRNVAELLINYKANIKYPAIYGRTLLQVAVVKQNSVDVLSYYIQQGCDVNYQDNFLCTPIMGSVRYCNTPLGKAQFRLLLEAGADVTKKAEFDNTVWDIARHNGCFKEAKAMYDEFKQERKAYGLLVNAVRLFRNQV